ncbi:AMP-dependent synthetase and ligase [Sulfitobacter noctilucicola]|uniref:Feruloyl-CoA synthase n=1 Tax=Sulfitobacter noctilucicola TaxID=1342301 RepID=A0A7W6M6N7_9RHOB|nr:feruloyl-CoA synthase [Sulfitobacter noctilucicola]KIN62378.1 AMP-dependent synthetase and ligase [Sulfitobacter noctilucicola]MBB4173088.1 feruloyl-CoA synthase [Sulfitobacter noctilucicola]
MTEHLNLKPHRVERTDRVDGTVLLRSTYQMGAVARCTGDWLDHWANATPEAVFLADRSGDGWREVTYAQAQMQVHAISSHLLTRDLGPDRPILVISGNSVEHGLLMLAAQYVGIPVVPVAEQYALIPAAHPRLIYAAGLVRPGMVFAQDAAQYRDALSLDVFDGIEVLSAAPAQAGQTAFADMLSPTGTDISTAAAAVGPETLAKILLTSGSTSDPKGVLTTQKMLTSNQAQIAGCLPFLADRPPRVVDWLPWNHVFGGSHNFNMMLANGGALYLDDGKPAPGLFDRTLENLSMISGTISFNVPIGFAQLVQALERDAALRETYFAELDMIFYAGASLPQETWAALERLARETGRPLPLITTSWGLTETAPAALIGHAPAKGAGIVGVPLPGIDVKLVPENTGRFDVRIKARSVMQGYLGNPKKTREAFDEEGYFITGDAMRFVDEADANQGLQFDGRLSEDFKLSTGIWVQAANLRLDLLARFAPFAQDVVITGAGRDQVGALILPNKGALAAQGWESEEKDGILVCAPLHAELEKRLAAHNTHATARATKIVNALCLSEPASMSEGEATAKGNINFPRFLERRAALVDLLYDERSDLRIEILH